MEVFPAPPGSGKGFTMARSQSYLGALPFKLPCGQCIGCRLDYARDWATRMHLERKMHEDAFFATFTLSDENLRSVSVDRRTGQLFLKRLRKYLTSNFGVSIRFVWSAEYGGETSRPHYHAIIYGWWPHDAKKWRQDRRTGDLHYRSAILEKLWGLGNVEFSHATFRTFGYVARYMLKKVKGKEAADFYRFVNEDGEVTERLPEFMSMSRKPGIGGTWFDAFHRDAFPSDFLVIDGRKRPVPRFFKKKLEWLASLKVAARRKTKAAKHKDNNTPERLAVREELTLRKIERLRRDLENS